MKIAAYIYSTASTHVEYVKYGPTPQGGVPAIERKVAVRGGANVANKHVITPRGVVTPVTAEDLAFLYSNEQFCKDLRTGFLTVESVKEDPDTVARDMNPRDGSAPATPRDFEKKPKVGALETA
jgi:hypothetical protein